jgi:hypothetical protein
MSNGENQDGLRTRNYPFSPKEIVYWHDTPLHLSHPRRIFSPVSQSNLLPYLIDHGREIVSSTSAIVHEEYDYIPNCITFLFDVVFFCTNILFSLENGMTKFTDFLDDSEKWVIGVVMRKVSLYP